VAIEGSFTGAVPYPRDAVPVNGGYLAYELLIVLLLLFLYPVSVVVLIKSVSSADLEFLGEGSSAERTSVLAAAAVMAINRHFTAGLAAGIACRQTQNNSGKQQSCRSCDGTLMSHICTP